MAGNMQNDREILSNLMDGKIDSRDGAMLGRIAAEDDARAAWSRYHLIGDVMRDGLTEIAPVEFAARLHDEIAQEPTVLAPRRWRRSRLRPVAGFAIAASVAALAVVGINRMTPEQRLPNTPELAVTAPAAPGEVPMAGIEQSAAAQSAVDPFQGSHHSLRRLNSYLVKFSEQRSSLAVPGVNPYVRIVGFQPD